VNPKTYHCFNPLCVCVCVCVCVRFFYARCIRCILCKLLGCLSKKSHEWFSQLLCLCVVHTYWALGSMMLKNFMPNVASKRGPAFILVNKFCGSVNLRPSLGALTINRWQFNRKHSWNGTESRNQKYWDKIVEFPLYPTIIPHGVPSKEPLTNPMSYITTPSGST